MSVQEFWKLVCSYLLHQHSWIRRACGRLLSMYYEACGQTGVMTTKQVNIVSEFVHLSIHIESSLSCEAEVLATCGEATAHMLCTDDTLGLLQIN